LAVNAFTSALMEMLGDGRHWNRFQHAERRPSWKAQRFSALCLIQAKGPTC